MAGDDTHKVLPVLTAAFCNDTAKAIPSSSDSGCCGGYLDREVGYERQLGLG